MVITKPEPYCPICGAKMVLRHPKPGQDWNPFWGCSQYPDCRGTRNIDPHTGKPVMDEIDEELHKHIKKTFGNEHHYWED